MDEQGKSDIGSEIVVLMIIAVILGILCVGSVALLQSDVSTEQVVVLTGETTESSSQVENAVRYRDLPESDKLDFRSHQSEVYNSEQEDVSYHLSSSLQAYSQYTHIFLDGVYYEIEIDTQKTLLSAVLFTLALSSGAVMLGSVLSIISILWNLVKVRLIETFTISEIRRYSLMLMSVLVLIASVGPFLVFTGEDTLTMSQIEETDSDVVAFEELSSEEKSEFTRLVSGDNLPDQTTSLTVDTYIRSDGELYYIQDTILPYNDVGAFSLVLGLTVFLFSLILRGNLIETKKEEIGLLKTDQ